MLTEIEIPKTYFDDKSEEEKKCKINTIVTNIKSCIRNTTLKKSIKKNILKEFNEFINAEGSKRMSMITLKLLYKAIKINNVLESGITQLVYYYGILYKYYPIT